ncbi:MAG: kinesin [Acidobacteria bacterium]|nr:MAG: kinesin [Acidobacteriota bacterium]
MISRHRFRCCVAVTAWLLLSAYSAPDVSQELRVLRKQIEKLNEAAKFAEALPLAQKALTISEKSFGPEKPETAKSLDDLGAVYVGMGDYAKAEPLYQRALTISEKALGPDYPETAGALNKLGELYIIRGALPKAEPILQRALEIREKALGPEHTDTAESLDNLGALYSSKGDYAKAEPILQRALRIREKTLWPEHPAIARSLNDLAFLYQKRGAYAKAEPLYQRALKIREKALGPGHPETAESLNNLGGLYYVQTDYIKAESLFERALKIRERALPPSHPDIADSLNNLAVAYDDMGEYRKAEPLYQRAVTFFEKELGPEHRETATSINNLAVLYDEMGDYAQAEPLFQRALKIREKALGPDHPSTAESLNTLAWLYVHTGEYPKAEPMFQRALKIYEKALGPEHRDTGTSLNNLALLYEEMGDYGKAEPLFKRTFEIWAKALGPDNPDTAASINNLAGLYVRTGDYGKAEPLFQRALGIYEKALGPEHRRSAKIRNNLALLYEKNGDYAKAEPLFQHALRTFEQALGSAHPETAATISNLALLHEKQGDYAVAESLFQLALSARREALGSDHPGTAETLNDLARVYANIGNPQEGLSLARQGRQVGEKILSNILSFTSEQERLAFQRTTNPYSLAASLGDAAEVAEIILRQKGVVLDSLLEDRLVAEASQDPKQRDVIAQVRSTKQRLMKLQLEVPKDFSEEAVKRREADKQELSNRVEQLEGGLARQVAGLGKARRALGVTAKQVQATLAKDEALIELIRYEHYLGKNKSEPRYGAVVITASREPKWVPLGSAVEIDKNITLYQKSARGATDEETLHNTLHSLYAQIWRPIEKSLPDATKRVILSPDGQLNFISFGTLLGTDERFVAEKYAISYVASGRDVLRETKPSISPMLLVYANPDFGGKTVAQNGTQGSAVALRVVEMRDLQSLFLPPLPGTAAEANALQKRAGKSAKVFLGANATEAELRQVNSPRILHLATHGFFQREIELGTTTTGADGESEIPKGKLVNPMHRSGLALAGAQRTLEAWNHGDVPPTENDGIVTAEEVGGLKLDGTWLVVLSACETGSGEVRAGEGVMGLRRGFIQAGAQNLLMTLWPISDQTTVQIMLDFYDAADKTHNAPQALADVQREWLVKLRKERGLLDAIRLAGPFIMSSQGRQ